MKLEPREGYRIKPIRWRLNQTGEVFTRRREAKNTDVRSTVRARESSALARGIRVLLSHTEKHSLNRNFKSASHSTNPARKLSFNAVTGQPYRLIWWDEVRYDEEFSLCTITPHDEMGT